MTEFAASSGPQVPITPRLGPGAAIGVVRTLQSRTEVHSTGAAYSGQSMNYPQVSSRQVVDFRLERRGPSGEPLPPLPVSLRGASFTGAIAEGDVVEVEGTMRRGTLVARRVFDHTTGALVEERFRRTGMVLAVVVGIVFVVVAVFIGRTFLDNRDRVGDLRDRQPTPVPGDFGKEMRDRARQDCYVDPNFTREQCDHVYGPS